MSTKDYPVCIEVDTPFQSPAESGGEEDNLGATAGVPRPLNLPESGSTPPKVRKMMEIQQLESTRISELQDYVQIILRSVDSLIASMAGKRKKSYQGTY